MDSAPDALGAFSELLDGRAIRYLFEIGGRTVRLQCRVRGRVLNTRRLKHVVFIQLDATLDLQLVFDRTIVGDDQFNEIQHVKIGNQIEAWVETEYEPNRTPPIRLVVRRFTLLLSTRISERRSDLDLNDAQGRIEIASVARSVANYLLVNGWTEIAPATISTTLDQPVDPLQVIFPGLGAETSLVVSPMAELVEIAQLTGTSSVFSISRLYSRAIRDGFTSPESLAIVAVQVTTTSSKEINFPFIEALIKYACEPVKSRLSQRERQWLNGQWERRSSKSIDQIHEVSAPVHQLSTIEGRIAFRTVWPHPMALVEGHVQAVPDGTVQCTTVHFERVMQLVSDIHYRRLQDSPRLT